MRKEQMEGYKLEETEENGSTAAPKPKSPPLGRPTPFAPFYPSSSPRDAIPILNATN